MVGKARLFCCSRCPFAPCAAAPGAAAHGCMRLAPRAANPLQRRGERMGGPRDRLSTEIRIRSANPANRIPGPGRDRMWDEGADVDGSFADVAALAARCHYPDC